jgi:WD40 repeat protein/transcriptional regulator with XRE-family HTH domain
MPVFIPSSTLEKFTTFGDLLRFLRRRVGMTQIELANAVGYSDTQISRLEQNERLPDIPTVEASFIPALGLEDEPKTITRLLELAANVRREDAPALGLCPYKGLNYFDEADADLFVGREALTAKLTERVLSLTLSGASHEPRFLAVVGASGSGKSSLVRAGLVSALRWNKSSTNWRIHIFTPTAHPLQSLAGTLNAEQSPTAVLAENLRQEENNLQIFVKRKWGSKKRVHVLFVVDQFEELFALCRSEEERASFISNLLTAASDADGSIAVVITLRADFYAPCANYPRLRESLAQSQEYIGAMNDEELRRAIEEPARRGRWEFEPGLVDLLLHDVGHEPGALPLLSHALLETWQRRRGRTMTLSGYTASGGVRGAIAETAEAVFTDQFTHEQQAIARRIFLRLTELGDEMASADTRRRATLNELILKPEEAATTRAVLKALADARLVTTSEDAVEVAHEALIREWPTLRGWLEDNREALRLHRHLTEASQEWSAMNGEPDTLYRGARLAQAREWAASHADEMNALEHEFLNASIEHSEREAAEREAQRQRELEAAQKLLQSERQRTEEQTQSANRLRVRNRVIITIGIIATALAVLASLFGWRSSQNATVAETNLSIAQANAVTAEAEGQRAEKETRFAHAREWAVAALNNLNVDPERSILLALEAVNVTYRADDKLVLPEAEEALHQAILASHLRLSWSAHQSAIWALAYSEDGNRLASASDDGTAKVWDSATGEELFTLNVWEEEDMGLLALSPDGTHLAASNNDGHIRVWDIVNGELLFSLKGHTDTVSAVAFSLDGDQLVTGSVDKTVILWDVGSGEILSILTSLPDSITQLAVSLDGTRLAISGFEGTVRIWDITENHEVMSIEAISEAPLAFNSDSKQLLTSWWNGNAAQLLNIDTGDNSLILSGHTNALFAILFSSDNKRIVTVSRDRTARVWDTATGRELLTLYGHPAPIYSAALNPDGVHLATGDEQGNLRIWNIDPDQELFSFSGVEMPFNGYREPREPLFSPDGTQLYAIFNLFATGLEPSSRVKVLDSATGVELLNLAEMDGLEFNSLAVSPDGRRLATGGSDGHVRVWDSDTNQLQLDLSAQSSTVWGIAFSPDGNLLATPGDNTAKIWDAKTGKTIMTLTGHSDEILGVAFSPDGTKLATASADTSAKIWDLSTGDVLTTLTAHSDPLWAIAFSPDGTRLATASRDGTARIWDAATGQALFILAGHTNTVTDLAFNADGTRLATTSNDGVLKLWEIATGRELLSLPGVGGAAFSPDMGRLATMNRDDLTLRMYVLRIEDLITLAKSRLTRSLTVEECKKYLHREACPIKP